MAVKYAQEQDGYYIGSLSQNEIKAICAVRQCENIDNLKRMIYNFPQELVERSIKARKSIKTMVKNGEISLDTDEIYGELRDNQTVAVAFMYWSKRSLLGDAVGSGKTVVTAGLINYLLAKGEMKKFIFFADTATSASQVQKELIKFTGLNIALLPSQATPMRKYIDSTDWSEIDGIVTTHSALTSDTLMKWLVQFLGDQPLFDTMFLDESSVIKNSNTKVYSYTVSLADKMARVHFLNATSFETCIMDIYNQIDVLRNELLPKKWRIEQNYCIYKQKPYWITQNGRPVQKYSRDLVDYKNQDEFKEKLKLVYFGRSKQQLGIGVEHSYKVYVTYPTLQQMFEINKGANYNQVLNCPSLLEKTEVKFDIENVPKLALLLDLVQNEFNGNTILVYCFNVDAIQKIKEECIKVGKRAEAIFGNTTTEDRERIKEAFNKREIDIVITNVKRSLNMYGGDVCIWYTYTGNPANMEQIRGRIDRNVDDSKKTFVLLLYKNSAEYTFFTEIAGKRAKSSRELTIDADTCIDYFIKEINEQKEEVKCY